ncbi:MAG: HAD-IA family hydrolase [Thermomicrobiales bacterium]
MPSKRQTNRPKAVIWDLDGTLIDSAEWHWLSWQEILHAEGYPITHEEFLRGFGRRNDEILVEYFGADADPARLADIADRKEARYRAYVEQHGVVVLPGVEDWLGYLGEAGWQMAVATSAPRENVGIILDVSGLALAFDAVVAREDVRAGKPDPEVYLKAASLLEAEPIRSIVVEDALAGVQGAHAAGMAAIGVGPRHADLGADLSAERLDDLDDDAFDVLLARWATTAATE